MSHRTRQCGLTMIGFLFVAAVVVACAMIGFRVAPAYIEYFAVQKSLDRSLAEAKDPTAAVEIRKSFDRFADTSYVDSVTSKDIEIAKQGNEVTASISWSRKLHLVANVSLYLDFDASATR
jgi:uncharacterized protein DUF4845